MDDPAASSLRIVKELSHSDIQLHLISSLVKPCFFVLRSDKGEKYFLSFSLTVVIYMFKTSLSVV